MNAADLATLSDDEIGRLYNAGLVSDEDMLQILPSRVSPQELAAIDAFAFGLAKLFHTPFGQLQAEAAAHRSLVSGEADPVDLTSFARLAADSASARPDRFVGVIVREGRAYPSTFGGLAALMQWFGHFAGTLNQYDYLAAFDKAAPRYTQGRAPIAYAPGPIGPQFGPQTGLQIGVVPARDQLAHLDHLVALHETFWAAYAQRHPSHEVRDFLRHQWDPWVTRWWASRPYLNTDEGLLSLRQSLEQQGAALRPLPVSDLLGSYVREAARGLAGLRETAANLYIPTPDLGTSQHGFSASEDGLKVSGAVSPAYNGAEKMSADQTQALIRSLEGALAQMDPATQQQELDTLMQQHELVAFLDAMAPGWRAVLDVRDSAQVSGWFLPFALGLPTGAAGGYFYRKWQEKHPGKLIPWISGWLGDVLHGGHSEIGRVAPWADAARSLQGNIYRDLGDREAREAVERRNEGISAEHRDDASYWRFERASAYGDYTRDYAAFFSDPRNRYGYLWSVRVALARIAYADRELARLQGSPNVSGVGQWAESVGQHWGAHILGAQTDDVARRREWPRTKALIHSAIREVRDAVHGHLINDPAGPAVSYVWLLEPQFGATQTIPFASHDEALAAMRDWIHGGFVALALFDRTSAHWPNPVNWHKSDDPMHEGVIAQQIAKYAPARTAGVGALPWQSIVGTAPWHSIIGTEPWQSIVGSASIVGTGPWGTIIGSAAVDGFRRQAQAAAEGMPGRVVGVVRDADNRWKLKSFRNADTADTWFGSVTRAPGRFTYAAYFDKDDVMFPHPLNEAIGTARAPAVPGSPIPRVVAEAP